MNMTKEEAAQVIASKSEQAMMLIREAQQLADEHGLSFTFDIAYGMGGTYVGRGPEDWSQSWEASVDDYDDDFGWRASSNSC